MMSNDDNCFVCGKKGHIGHHWCQVQCYNCDDFGHFIQDSPEKTAPPGTPHHHSRSCCHWHDNHSHRDRSHSFHQTQPMELPWQVRITPLTPAWQKLQLPGKACILPQQLFLVPLYLQVPQKTFPQGYPTPPQVQHIHTLIIPEPLMILLHWS